jgi:uncharacterized DUF497 family protein
MPPQLIIWDPEKARRNREKHGIDFEEEATVFRDPLLLVMPDLEHSQDEERWLTLGRSTRQILLVVAHTEDERTIRIISARKAEPKERGQYEQQS